MVYGIVGYIAGMVGGFGTGAFLWYYDAMAWRSVKRTYVKLVDLINLN